MNKPKIFQPLFFYSASIVGLSVIILISAVVVSANGNQQGGFPEEKRCYATNHESGQRVEVPCPQPTTSTGHTHPKKALILDENTNPSSVSEGDISTSGEQTQQNLLVGLTNVQPFEQNSLDQGQSDQDQGQSDQDNQQ